MYIKHPISITTAAGVGTVDVWGVKHEPVAADVLRRAARAFAEYSTAAARAEEIEKQLSALRAELAEVVAAAGETVCAFKDADAALTEEEMRRSKESDDVRTARSRKRLAERLWSEYDSAINNPCRNNPQLGVEPVEPDCPRPEEINIPDVAPVSDDVRRRNADAADALMDPARRTSEIVDAIARIDAERLEVADKLGGLADELREAVAEYEKAKAWDKQSKDMEKEDAETIRQAREDIARRAVAAGNAELEKLGGK